MNSYGAGTFNYYDHDLPYVTSRIDFCDLARLVELEEIFNV
jgi:hypothetical protein